MPKGVTTLHAHLGCMSPRATRGIAVLEWESLRLYPTNTPVHDIASLEGMTRPLAPLADIAAAAKP